MKDIKCPLCGTQLKQFNDIHDTYHVRVGCQKCKWTTFLTDPEKADQAAEAVISKFPPIMRLNSGDKLLLEGAKDYFTVVSVELGKAVIHTDKGYCYIDDVVKWPWELEQKGRDE
ncbi:hypothetical protein [Akkermansia sp.]|uniref:hypothetical protein n=1 Tax=Akkermansia sp. TaxID=1872421 RepID=UPI0025BFE0D0|nr:hypothetical protein [Akkermansia sp.]MCC8147933.1 hypothetical protein [Akkermansia sp.]